MEGFYRFFVKFFQHRPSWLVEITHMEEPWQVASQKVQNDYNGQWPQPSSKKGHEIDPEWEKGNVLNQLFKDHLSPVYYRRRIEKIDKLPSFYDRNPQQNKELPSR